MSEYHLIENSNIRIFDIWFDEPEGQKLLYKKGLFVSLLFLLIALWVPLPRITVGGLKPDPPALRPNITIALPEFKTEEATQAMTIDQKPKIPVPARLLDSEPEVIVEEKDEEFENYDLELGGWEGEESFEVSQAPLSKISVPGNYPGLESPVFVHRVAPVYPKLGLKYKIQGYVTLEATLTREGEIIDISVIRGLGKSKFGFEEAASEALKKWDFIPGRLKNEPVNVRLVLRIDFRLK